MLANVTTRNWAQKPTLTNNFSHQAIHYFPKPWKSHTNLDCCMDKFYTSLFSTFLVKSSKNDSWTGVEIRKKIQGSSGPLDLKLWGSSLIFKSPRVIWCFGSTVQLGIKWTSAALCVRFFMQAPLFASPLHVWYRNSRTHRELRWSSAAWMINSPHLWHTCDTCVRYFSGHKQNFGTGSSPPIIAAVNARSVRCVKP